jgi:hypothetical protein
VTKLGVFERDSVASSPLVLNTALVVTGAALTVWVLLGMVVLFEQVLDFAKLLGTRVQWNNMPENRCASRRASGVADCAVTRGDEACGIKSTASYEIVQRKRDEREPDRILMIKRLDGCPALVMT